MSDDDAIPMADRIAALRQQPRRRWLGLMSGTSCDGIDAATVELSWEEQESGEPQLRAEVIAGETHDFPPQFADALREVLDRGPTAEEAAVWDARLGDRFAEAAAAHLAALSNHETALPNGEAGLPNAGAARQRLRTSDGNLRGGDGKLRTGDGNLSGEDDKLRTDSAEIRAGAVDAIAVSGHTFAHRPDLGATLQVGQPARVRARTGLPVVSGFRTADVARGGEGAPLVPAADRVLFGRDDRAVVVLNLGGIGNITSLPDRRSDPTALDTGPANLVLDGLWRAAFPQADERFDRDGACAMRGAVDPTLLNSWNQHPYFESGRRSTGREEFGAEWIASTAEERSRLSPEDQLATASAWIAATVHRAVERLVNPAKLHLYVGGGGAHHQRLLQELRERFPQVEVLTAHHHGVSADLREAAAFAILGDLFLHDQPGSFPTTTGCHSPAPIGAWY